MLDARAPRKRRSFLQALFCCQSPRPLAKMPFAMPMKKTWSCPGDGVPGKIFEDLDQVEVRIDALKRAGKRVVFSNGGFDLLHVGHVRSLREARSLGDHLIVAVNGDRSVREAKGPSRPMFPQAERAELVASLGCVDTVFIFDDATADAVLRVLKPHVHAKGPDYSVDTVPERSTVLAYGGQIAIVGDPKDHSSTELQRKLKTLSTPEPKLR